MKARDFHLVSRWQIRGSAADVYAALLRLDALPDWWPGVESARVDPARPDSARIALQGLSPIQLRIDVRIAATRPTREICFDAQGDLVGRGRWTLVAVGDLTDVTLIWDVRLEHPLLARLPALVRPLLRASHHFLMWRGERGLNRMLRRRALLDARC